MLFSLLDGLASTIFDSFKRLANNRVNRAIKAIQLVSNLSNKSHYKYTSSQAKKIILALEKEIRELKSKFNNSKNNVHGDYFEID